MIPPEVIVVNVDFFWYEGFTLKLFVLKFSIPKSMIYIKNENLTLGRSVPLGMKYHVGSIPLISQKYVGLKKWVKMLFVFCPSKKKKISVKQQHWRLGNCSPIIKQTLRMTAGDGIKTGINLWCHQWQIPTRMTKGASNGTSNNGGSGCGRDEWRG